ncbi:hypothetical protein IM792_19310 [Mucilaginibacter sp. JRF]|uniref:hypothetical protein n=1 Tax=Mucilaginibacter sp. JRF TaxID=2780088 RepID=UPI00187E1A7B|nr:hypothetical protein [Mucilaginibacter sp. JRF]MBE9586606.1 hypothetical protein [Mucilaginibacter sp. JRF]
MSDKAINYKVILKRDGQTQQQRMPEWLDPLKVPVDARTKQQLYAFLQAVAGQIKYYDIDKANTANPVNGTWADFFDISFDEFSRLADDNKLPPHLALWDSFIELYTHPQALMNKLTQRHLDFYYGEVLKFKRNAPVPDRVHVQFELKKGTTNTLLAKGTKVLAGKDDLKKELHYELAHDIVVNNAKIEGLKSLYIDQVNKNFIHHAPIANSIDGLGAELDESNPKWLGFGSKAMPLANVGFCLAADVLLMKQGTRRVIINLSVSSIAASAVNTTLTADLFSVSITGEKGWIGPKTLPAKITSADNKVFTITVTFTVNADEPAVTVYNKAIHGGEFDTTKPIIQLLVNNQKADFGYSNLSSAELMDATITAEVTGVKGIDIENDQGSLDAKKSFKPFGSLAEKNSNFYIKHDEAFSKRLKEFSLDVEWKNIPAAQLGDYFKNYGGSNNNNANFTALAAFKDGFSWQESSKSVSLFNVNNAQASTSWKFTNPALQVKLPIFSFPVVVAPYLVNAGQTMQQNLSSKISYLLPAYTSLQSKSVKSAQLLFKPLLILQLNLFKDIRKGMLSLRLNHGFMFDEFRNKYAAEILRFSKDGGTLALPAEPFAPEVQSITLNYTAVTTKTSFNGLSLNDYIDEEIEFFHYGPFGQMREHAYAKSQHAFLQNNLVKLLPEYTNEGELYIGLSGLQAQDSVCVLFQLAEGSANPEKEKVAVTWSVLCDDYWKQLTNDDLLFDTTNGLLTSGIIKYIIPREATTSNSIFPPDLLWLKASIKKNTDTVCNLSAVLANAAVAVFFDQANAASHLAAPLVAGTVNKMVSETGAIKTVKQPYASFGGKVLEDSDAYYIRVSERLRHKQRGVSIWDHERLILQQFPQVHKVKCINHASPGSFYSPGHTMFILVPDLTNRNAVDPFQPKVDKNTIEEVYAFVKGHTTAWAEQHVSNPYYEPVKVVVSLKLKRGFEFNYYEKVINQRLQEFLSPWLRNTSSDIHFGGKVTKSMVVKFLEDMEYVDYITQLSLFHYGGKRISFGRSVEVAEASNPAAILVSHNHHEVINN